MAQVLGRYVIHTDMPTLNSGTFCRVYCATDTLTEEKVVARVCTVPGPRDADPDMRRANAVNELQIMERLQKHQNAQRLLSSAVDDTRVISIVEYTPYGDLCAWMHENYVRHVHTAPERLQISERQCRGIFKQVLETLRFAHSLDIAHRDIKPENVLLYTDASFPLSTDSQMPALRAVLIDWNLASDKPHFLTKPSGTIEFVAPEVVGVGTLYYNAKFTDIWSLGVLLYMLLTARHPLGISVEMALDAKFARVLTHSIEYPSYLSKEARTLVEAMLQRVPLLRPSSKSIEEQFSWARSNDTAPLYAHQPQQQQQH